MIPAYSEQVNIKVIEKNDNLPLEQQVNNLEEQVRLLKETVDYMNRERSRMKSEIASLTAQINRQ
jgi:predicted RNase H-like nuclease (RuvC/YqgF family)